MAITQARLKEVLDYCPDTGVFRWKVTNRGKRTGCVAGSRFASGYRRINVDGEMYRAHRLAWFYVYGRWPEIELDHINGERDDNRIDNLREVSKSENHQNRKMYANNRTGVCGVCWHKKDRRWDVRVRKKGMKTLHARVSDFFEAVCLRKIWELQYGVHPNNGRS